jgi:hypothetical protein
MQPTTPTTQALTQHVRQSLELLKTLRDEIRVELHLAGMEAKDEWRRLETRFPVVSNLTMDASHTTRGVLDEAIANLRAFRAALLAERP